MTLPASYRNDRVGDGTTKTFSYTFKIWSAEEMRVVLTDPDTGVVTEPTSGFSVTGVGSDGGNVVFDVAPADDTPIVFLPTTTYEQDHDLVNETQFFQERIEDGLDKLCRQSQLLKEEASRTLRLPESEAGGSAMVLPTAEQRAGQSLTFDTAGNPIASSPSAAPISSAMQPVVASATLDLAATAFVFKSTLGSSARNQRDRASDEINVLDYGADKTGAADSTTAINTALSSGKHVRVPAGTYKTTGQLNLTVEGQCLRGDGRATTTINVVSTTAAGIVLGAGLNEFSMRDFSITRTGTPVAGAYGIDFRNTLQQGGISNVRVTGHYIGVSLGGASFCYFENSLIEKCLSHGVQIITTSSAGLQWTLRNVYSGQNAGSGFTVDTTGSTAGASVGELINLSSYGNSGYGIAFLGASGKPINGVRMLGGFFGQDGNTEIYFNTFGQSHRINGTYTEAAGVAATGPNLSTAASNVGNGVNITANNYDVDINNARAIGHSYGGIATSATGSTTITGCNIRLNGAAVSAGQRFGISFNAGKVIVSGNVISGHLNGVEFFSDTGCMVGNALFSNTSDYVAGVTLVSSVVSPNFSSAPLMGTATIDPASLASGAEITLPTNITITGATFGDGVAVSASYSLQGMIAYGFVSAPNTISIRLRNGTAGAIDLASGTWTARLLR